MTGFDDLVRSELVTLARKKKARVTAFSKERPTDWRPGQVRNPKGGLDTHFTDATAWELIASKLEDGHGIEVIDLRKPPDTLGYVMKIWMESDRPLLYVKLQLGEEKIIGRSFHYSEH